MYNQIFGSIGIVLTATIFSRVESINRILLESSIMRQTGTRLKPLSGKIFCHVLREYRINRCNYFIPTFQQNG